MVQRKQNSRTMPQVGQDGGFARAPLAWNAHPRKLNRSLTASSLNLHKAVDLI
jgi:hypothetical protein